MTTNTMINEPNNDRPIEINPTVSMSDPSISSEHPTSESQELWVPIQMNRSVVFIDDAIASAKAFYNNNHESLKVLGLGLLAILAIKLLFAGLSAIDSIPLFTPFLKLVGLVYTIRFVWRYLIREQDRQELVEVFNRTKSEVLGNQN